MPHTKAAFDLMDSLTPAWAELKPETMLYVGWRHDCHPWWYRTFAPALGIKRISVLEVFPPNVAHAEQMAWEGKFGEDAQVIQGNILHPSLHFAYGQFDVIFWDHGPEHVTKVQLGAVTPCLQSMRNKLLIYCCPWGHWPQGVEDGNEHERHLWDVDVKDMQDLGMSTFTVGRPGQESLGEMVAIG